VIGAFSVRFTNIDGELQTVWLAVPEIVLGQGASRSTTLHDLNNPYALARRTSGRELAVFNMNGTGGGSYRVAAAVEIKRSPPLTAWEYLGRPGGVDPVEGLVSDTCNRPQAVKVQGRNGAVLMTDEPREVRVAKPRFGWLCASSQEWATCGVGTNLVVGQRGPDDVLRWYCFRERSF
jgi:hypothetical protein